MKIVLHTGMLVMYTKEKCVIVIHIKGSRVIKLNKKIVKNQVACMYYLVY